MVGFDPGDEGWAAIESLLPKKKGDPPERYGPRTPVYNRYVRRGEHGVWRGGAGCEDALVFVDSSIVKAHRAAKWRKRGELRQDVGRSRSGRGSKVHAAADREGCSLRIAGAQTNDSKAFGAFRQAAPLACVADKAYGSGAVRQPSAIKARRRRPPLGQTRARQSRTIPTFMQCATRLRGSSAR